MLHYTQPRILIFNIMLIAQFIFAYIDILFLSFVGNVRFFTVFNIKYDLMEALGEPKPWCIVIVIYVTVSAPQKVNKII